MPTNVVFVFENAKQVSLDFTQAHLGPALERLGKLSQTDMVPIDYLDRARAGAPLRGFDKVAGEASAKWDAGQYRRTVFVVDLDAKGSDTTDGTFGLKVLLELSKLLGFKTIGDLLSHSDFLSTILTIYGHRLPRAIPALWGSLALLDIVNRNEPPSKGDAVSRARAVNPRLVVADRASGSQWLANLVANWL
jgi:hypothetical protein